MQLEVGNNVTGKITGITNFGAFVQLEGGKVGLIHISEIALNYVKDINDHVKVGDEVKVKVVGITNGKISLSVKKVLEEEKKNQSSRPADVEMFTRASEQDLSFEEKMSRFKQDSDDKMLALKRNFESKRGSNRKRG
ncbi:MAG: S1 RNA-binding domain-containing protein [Clostridia bacterium]|nr:S1 RNA-binding domain-containing protein [Clostridia bacterium]